VSLSLPAGVMAFMIRDGQVGERVVGILMGIVLLDPDLVASLVRLRMVIGSVLCVAVDAHDDLEQLDDVHGDEAEDLLLLIESVDRLAILLVVGNDTCPDCSSDSLASDGRGAEGWPDADERFD